VNDKNNKIDILLVSDLHLGIKSGFFIKDNDRIAVLKRIIDIACDHDVLLIGGDFIEIKTISESDFNIVAESLQKLRESGKSVFYTPGFSELDLHGNPHERLKKLNVDGIFCEKTWTEPYCIPKGEMKLFVYGFPASKDFNLNKLNRKQNDGVHIALLHIDFIKERQKKEFDVNAFDFFALGYNHNFKMYKIFEKIIAAHPGSPLPLNIDEIGDRYALSIRVSNSNPLQIKRVKVNAKKIVDETEDCTKYIDADALIDKVKTKVDINDYVKLRLIGDRCFPLKSTVLEKLNDSSLGFCLIDDTTPSIEALQLEAIGENTIKYEFLELLYDKIKNGIVDKEDASKVLRYVNEHKMTELEEWLCDISEL
jgi:DNA repair exonuclease SbcCD nuclease subunit